MIDKHFLFPEYYIAKVPKCDNCKGIILKQTGQSFMAYPVLIEYKCPKCNKIYTFGEDELQGEWKWRVI
jgi:phage FluMu protein Com